MRIGILTNAFPPDGRGGAERTALIQAELFARLGHEVRVWAPGRGVGDRGQGGGVGESVIQGVHVVRFASPFSRLGRMRIAQRFAFHVVSDAVPRMAVARQIIGWKPGVLLTHNLTGCGFGTPRVVQAQGVRWVHTLHDIQLTDPSGQETAAFSHSAVARMWRGCWSVRRRLSFGTPDTLISPTRWLLDWHVAAGFTSRRSSVVIPNPIDPGAPRDRSVRHPATLAYVGRLSAEKGFGVFLEAIPRFPAALVGKIIVIGGGDMMSRAERLEDNRLLLRGALSFEDARRAIAEADLLVAPSQILENQQTVLLEAMAEGTPVVATDVGGTRETLEGTGSPVLSGDTLTPQVIGDTVMHLLSHAQEWQRISQAMQVRAARHDQKTYFEALMRAMG